MFSAAPKPGRTFDGVNSKVGLVVIFLAISGCAGTPIAPKENTGANEVLTRLTELQDELKALRGEVAQLREAVTEIHRASVRPDAAPPSVAARPTLDSVRLDDGAFLGDNGATVAIVEFSDYQCPFCFRFYSQTLPRLKQGYIDSGKLKYVFRDFPLSFHPQARGAAVAARCAGRQGAYWRMHDALFGNQRRLGPELYAELATDLKLDQDAFNACLTDGSEGQKVEVDFSYGQELQVQGTPTFFIGRLENGQLVDARRIVGAQPFSAFAQAIDALLR